MSDSIDRKTNQAMERLAGSIIEFIAVGRSLRIIEANVGQQTFNCLSKVCLPNENIMSGSMFEGMPDNLCGDVDQMMTKPIFPVVRWPSQAVVNIHECGYVMAEPNPSNPAYLKLKVVDKDILHEDVRITVDNGYMKSTDFIDALHHDLKKGGIRVYKTEGPSNVSAAPIDSILKTTRDVVVCLKCQSWPPITDDFFTRERLNKWPSQDLLNTISDLDCFVVPIGHPGTDSKDNEWRLSFSVAEKKLIHEMCEPYFNCMIALKALKNKHFVPSDPDKPTSFCSYFIKTACLWMCETFPNNDYSLMDLIRKILDWLIDCYQQKKLPHYFIPRQNLIGHHSRELCEETGIKLG
ncbi:cyclic GMP-AMP synthase-like receptor 2 [Antedon mediterranea]|uniref:cyclic GMP-AMP synthase-like receptor 2 n=1 Tax=Antedon mediterranea TaxID=105859 RepID=UPI003AF7D5D8